MDGNLDLQSRLFQIDNPHCYLSFSIRGFKNVKTSSITCIINMIRWDYLLPKIVRELGTEIENKS